MTPAKLVLVPVTTGFEVAGSEQRTLVPATPVMRTDDLAIRN